MIAFIRHENYHCNKSYGTLYVAFNACQPDEEPDLQMQ
jgi:hypothetical protein